MDEPIGDSAAIPTFLLSEMAQNAGVKVILNGTGGDEAFGGYPRYLNGGLVRSLRIGTQPFRNVMSFLWRRPMEVNTAIRLKTELVNYISRINGVDLIKFRGFLKSKLWFDAILNGMDCVMKECFESFSGLSQADRFMRFDLKTYLVGNLFFLLDKMTMAHSIEGRVPLADYRIVELMASVPSQLKIESGMLKSLVRETLKSILPEDSLNRQKIGFGGPVFFWLSNNIIDGSRMFDELSPVTHEILDIPRIRNIVVNKKYTGWNSQFVYNLAIFELWYRDVFKKWSSSTWF